MSEGGRLVEVVVEGEMGDRKRKSIHWLMKIPAKSEVGK